MLLTSQVDGILLQYPKQAKTEVKEFRIRDWQDDCLSGTKLRPSQSSVNAPTGYDSEPSEFTD